METWIGSIEASWVIGAATITIAFLLLTILVRVVQTSWRLLLVIGAIWLALYYGVGMSPGQMRQELRQLSQTVVRLDQKTGISDRLLQFFD